MALTVGLLACFIESLHRSSCHCSAGRQLEGLRPPQRTTRPSPVMRRVIEPGAFAVMVGPGFADLQAVTLEAVDPLAAK